MRAAIVLAAGASRRFGRRDKLVERVRGRSLLDHAITNAVASGAGRVLLINNDGKYRSGITVVRSRNARQGLAASLAAGLAALRPIEREVLIFLADMPFATAPRLRLAPGIDAVRPQFRKIPGHPMLVRAAIARQSLRPGDKGLAAIAPSLVAGGAGNIFDVDTFAALRRVRLHGSRALAPRSSKT